MGADPLDRQYGSRTNWKAQGYSVRTTDWRYTEWRAIDSGTIVGRELCNHFNDLAETKNVAEMNESIVRSHSARLAKQFGF